MTKPPHLFAMLVPLLITSGVLAAPCAQTDYVLSSQAKVNALGQTGCTDISGNLTIKNSSDITDLDGLANIASIGGYLSIMDNAALTDLDGLISLSRVGGYVYIAGNDELINCEGMALSLKPNIHPYSPSSCKFYSRWVKNALATDARERILERLDADREQFLERERARKEADELRANRQRELAAKERELALAAAAEARLQACDSFGFERGTDSHAQCAMQLYMNEQNQNNNIVTARDNEQQNSEQKALLARQRQQLARQEAIQEAILKEQERVRRMEQSMKLIELGTGIATGSFGGRSTPRMQSHTYTINGQIINCTTTGSSTDCR